jgi:hypothetical protein
MVTRHALVAHRSPEALVRDTESASGLIRSDACVGEQPTKQAGAAEFDGAAHLEAPRRARWGWAV